MSFALLEHSSNVDSTSCSLILSSFTVHFKKKKLFFLTVDHVLFVFIRCLLCIFLRVLMTCSRRRFCFKEKKNCIFC